MLSSSILSTVALALATLITHSRSLTVNTTQLGPILGNPTNRANQSMPYLPKPRPNQTIGDYFDLLLSLNQTSLKARRLQRTPTFTEALWTDGGADYNISLSRCLHVTDNAGVYTTAQNETLENATLADILNDLHTHKHTTIHETRLAYAARVEENAQLAINELTALLSPPDSTSPTAPLVIPHDEFRHLLAPLSSYVAVILRAATISETSVALFAGMSGHLTGYVPESGVVSVALTTYGLHVAEGIRQLARYGDGRMGAGDHPARRGLAFITAAITNAFLGWLRHMARVFAGEWLRDAGEVLPMIVGKPNPGNRNRTLGFREGTIDGTSTNGNGILRNMMGTLGTLDDPMARLASWARVEGGSGCHSRT